MRPRDDRPGAPGSPGPGRRRSPGVHAGGSPAPPPAPGTAGPVPAPKPPPPRPRPALGNGGAARGFAHIGVIQVLEEAGVRPALVAGTSAGSLVAALSRVGQDSARSSRLADAMDEATIADWSFPGAACCAARRWRVRARAHRRADHRADEAAAGHRRHRPSTTGGRSCSRSAIRAWRCVERRASGFQPVRIGNREYVDGAGSCRRCRCASPARWAPSRDRGRHQRASSRRRRHWRHDAHPSCRRSRSWGAASASPSCAMPTS